MRDDIVLIPGLCYQHKNYSSIIDFLSSAFKLHVFKPDYRKSCYEIVEDLEVYLKEEGLKNSHFVTFSFGSVIFRLFYQYNKEIPERVVMMCPNNSGAKALETFHVLPFFDVFLGKAYRNFLDEKEEITMMPLPPETGVMAGDKRFSWKEPESYFISLFMNTKNSDGKVLIDETKFEGMKDFTIIHAYHDNLPNHPEALEKAENREFS